MSEVNNANANVKGNANGGNKGPRKAFGRKNKQNQGRKQMKRIKTVWVTEPTKPFTDDYKVGKQIGEPGQFGKAFRCIQKKDQAIFAVKEISKARFYRVDRSQKRREALLRAMQGEIDIMRRLRHKYIVNMEAVYEDKHTLWIVMEECKGGELFDRIRARTRYNEKDAAPIIRMVCEALNYMHEYHRVVHCDLKPDNILFVTNKEDSDLKIIDFGMSKVLPRLRSLNELCGTPYYTAPEIIEGDYAHGADMWSVGVILFVMLYGFPPFYVDPNKYFGQKEAQAIYKLIKKGFTPDVKKGYGPWFPRKIPVSEEGRDFMAKLMETDQAKRLTAREALQHPWIVNGGPKPKKNALARLQDVISNNKDEKQQEITNNMVAQFANFTQSQGFKYAITALFRDQFQELRPQHFNSLKKLFKRLDTDGNGRISLQEFEQGMLQLQSVDLKKEQIRAIFAELDVQNIGEIAFDEFLNAAVHDYLVASDQRLYQVFRDLDTDDDGKIKMTEIEAQLKKLNMYNHVNDLLDVLKKTDTNNDGVIDYEEFLHALHPDFNKPPDWFWDVKDNVYEHQKQEQDANGNANANNNNNNNNNANANGNANANNGNANANGNVDANGNAKIDANGNDDQKQN